MEFNIAQIKKYKKNAFSFQKIHPKQTLREDFLSAHYKAGVQDHTVLVGPFLTEM